MGLLVLVSLTVVPMLAVWYGFKGFRWGFHNYPTIAGLVVADLVLAVIFADLSFPHFFANCQVALKWGCSNY